MVAAALDGERWFYLGENHATAEHQKLEADMVQALVDRGRRVIVGVEFFQRPKQSILDQWSAGELKEDEFLSKADWKGQWGYPYSFYRPLFEVIRKNRLALVGLNVPRDWVRAVGKGGPDALTAEQAAQVPNLNLGNRDHRSVFNALMGGHPPTGPQGENIYAAQVLWDEGMADTAVKYRRARNSIFVVIAGSGHVMYGQGINWRVRGRTGERGKWLVMTQSDGPAKVARGMGDFVYVSPAVRG
jgi:uncharacterized iron-regulated protein